MSSLHRRLSFSCSSCKFLCCAGDDAFAGLKLETRVGTHWISRAHTHDRNRQQLCCGTCRTQAEPRLAFVSPAVSRTARERRAGEEERSPRHGAPPVAAMGTRVDAARDGDGPARVQAEVKLLRGRSLPRQEQRLHDGEYPLPPPRPSRSPRQRGSPRARSAASADADLRYLQILWNQGIFQTVMLGKAIQAVFLGELRLIEIEVGPRSTPCPSESGHDNGLTNGDVGYSGCKSGAGSPSPRLCSR